MKPNPRNTYKRLNAETAISEASPIDLIVMVYGAILDNLRLAQKAIEEGREESVYVAKVIDLIQRGLSAALDFEHGGDISRNLSALYDWALREILQARLKKNALLLTGVIEVFRNLESAWLEIRELRATTSSETKGEQAVERGTLHAGK